MTTNCIHGFTNQQCHSCRTCAHGQTTGTCPRCRAAATSRKAVAVEAQPSQDHGGFEIYYEPAVSGWRYRADEAAPSPLSYRSAFLARKAVDAIAAGGPVAATAPSKRGSKRRR